MPNKEMSSRERVLTAAHRNIPDRIPRLINLEKYMQKSLKNFYGTSNLGQVLRLDIQYIDIKPTNLKHDYSGYFSNENITWDEWGRGRIWDGLGQYAEYFYPLEHVETMDELIQFPWPDLDADYRFSGLNSQVKIGHEQGFAVAVSLEETVFEIAWQLRGMVGLFEDIHNQDEKANYLLNRITAIREIQARACALAGVDLIFLGDDVAMQTGLMLSPRMYRRWFKPLLTRVIKAAKEVNPDVLVQYHSDGMINDLVPDLLEAGIDILNPVQPECVDHDWIKKTYGSQVSFSGGLGVQSVLPFGSPEEVRFHVQRVIQSLGSGGGLIIGPSHLIERDVPIQNIETMLSAIDEFGRYDS